MIKSMARIWVWVAFAALLGFASCAFGQDEVNLNVKVMSARNGLLNVPSSFFALALASDHRGGDSLHGNGCGDRPRRDSIGRDHGRWGGGGNGGGCASVPEGGTAMMYLLLAGLSCLGPVVLRSRRQACARETN
jgi:hypothetical protein